MEVWRPKAFRVGSGLGIAKSFPGLSGNHLGFHEPAAIAGAAREDGWAPLSNVGSLVVKSNPSFDPRNYGCEKLGELVGRQSYLKVKKVPATVGSAITHIYVRIK